MPIAVGSQAPDFTLKSKTADGLVDVKLSANFGQKQTVILFFPLAYTGVCTQEMCDQTSGLPEYENLGAAVYAISVDSPFTQEAWAKTNKIGAVGVEAAPVEFVEERHCDEVNLTGRESGRARVFLRMRTRKKERPRQFRKTVCGGGGRAST